MKLWWKIWNFLIIFFVFSSFNCKYLKLIKKMDISVFAFKLFICTSLSFSSTMGDLVDLYHNVCSGLIYTLSETYLTTMYIYQTCTKSHYWWQSINFLALKITLHSQDILLLIVVHFLSTAYFSLDSTTQCLCSLHSLMIRQWSNFNFWLCYGPLIISSISKKVF